MTTRDILLRAAELIEKRGHAVGSYRTADGKVCAVAAIDTAAVDGGCEPTRAYSRLCASIGSANIAAWNDRSSAATVIAGLRKAAEDILKANGG